MEEIDENSSLLDKKSFSSNSTGSYNSNVNYDLTSNDSETIKSNNDNMDIEDSIKNNEIIIPHMGVSSSAFLILNKMIGTGIFSTPSLIYGLTGSIGGSLLLWIIGGIVTFSGLSVYMEYGLEIPKSGGEKNYLERVYKKPKHLVTCVFLTEMVLLGFSSGNCYAFGKYFMFLLGIENPSELIVRLISVLVITFSVALHIIFPKYGSHLLNILGIFKIIVLLLISFGGFFALFGFMHAPKPDNFKNIFQNDGFGGGGIYNYSIALLNVIYSFKGWENSNYVLDEIKNPKRTLIIAAPLAVGGTTLLYFFANIAYFAAISKNDLIDSGVVVAGVFLKNVFGPGWGQKALPIFVILSNLGNVLAVSYSQGRINRELAREGFLPGSKILASNKPFNSPAAGLLLHWLLTTLVLLVPPPGEAYQFIIDLYTYPGAWINILVAAGLIYLRWNRKAENWGTDSNGWNSYFPITFIFLLSNIFLAIFPFYPPSNAQNSPSSYPYYAFPTVGCGVLLFGVFYWYVGIYRGHLRI